MPVLLQAAAAETLSIMTASSTTDQMALVVQANAVPALVSLLQAKDQNVLESALKALSNIAGDSPRMRDKVIEAGAVPPLLLLLNDASISLTVARHAIFCLSIMCRSKTPRPDWEAVSVALPTLAKLLFTYTDDEEVLTDTAWTLSYLSDGTNDRIQRVIDTGVCARLVELLAHESVAVQTPVLRVAGNIVTGDDMQTQAMLKAGVLDGLCPMLDSRKESIRKEACWTISNITAGTADQVQMVIDTGMVPRLIDLMWREGSNSIQREACWAMTNATERGQEHPEWIEYFVSHGILKGIASFLDGHDRMTDVATSGLENIFKVGADIAADCVNPYALHFKEAGYLDQLVAARESESGGERAAQLCEDFFLGEVGLSEIE
ncbi:armadillo-type protein [Blastocladiella britannica]|nr:armadillo-type protein [Blastocladiella britannica]